VSACKRLHEEELPMINEGFRERGKVYLIDRYFPLPMQRTLVRRGDGLRRRATRQIPGAADVLSQQSFGRCLRYLPSCAAAQTISRRDERTRAWGAGIAIDQVHFPGSRNLHDHRQLFFMQPLARGH